MSDLVRRIKQEFACWYTPRENRAFTESTPNNTTLYLGLLEIPHPTLEIRLCLNQVLENEKLAELIDKPLADVAKDEFIGSFTGMDDLSIDFVQFDIRSSRFGESGTYYLDVGDTEYDVEKFGDADGVIEFIRNLPQYPLSKLTHRYDEADRGTIATRTKNGIVVTRRDMSGKSINSVTIDDALLERIEETKMPAAVDKILTELAGKEPNGDVDAQFFVELAHVTKLYAKRSGVFEIAGRVHAAGRRDDKLRRIADSTWLATFVTFFDCQYERWKSLPETEFKIFDTNLKLPEELTRDETFLESIARYAQQRDSCKEFLEQRFMFTPNAKLTSSRGSYFTKQVILSRVPSADYELEVARRLQDLGFNVPKPVGLAVIRKAPHVVFEYAENSVNLMGQDSSYEQHKELSERLKKQKKQVYTALGQYVRKMVDAGIVDQDMAGRNFMVKFDDEGNFQHVFQVDFEKTEFIEENPNLRTVTKHKLKERALRDIKRQMTQAERNYFNVGYTDR